MTQLIPDLSVRPAQLADAAAWGEIQAKNMSRVLQRVVGQVSPQILATFSAEEMANSWAGAIANPPSAKHHLLSAYDRGVVKGFAALAPAPKLLVELEDSPLNEQPAQAEIVAFEVADWEQLTGHEGRLINAIADILQKTGAKRVQTWITAGDDPRTKFFTECGFAPAGLRTNLAVGSESLIQHLWYTDF